jgi:hypothetical protein
VPGVTIRCRRRCPGSNPARAASTARSAQSGLGRAAGNMAARPGGLDELGREPLDPPIDGDVIDGDAPLGQQFLDVPLGQAIAQVPADRERDHLSREPEAGEHRGLPKDVIEPVSRGCDQSTQRCRSGRPSGFGERAGETDREQSGTAPRVYSANRALFQPVSGSRRPEDGANRRGPNGRGWSPSVSGL